MKTNYFFLVVALMAFTFASCNKNDDSGTTPSGPSNYTVLLYGTGDGGDMMDEITGDILKNMLKHGPDGKFQMMVMYTPDMASINAVSDLKHTYCLGIGGPVTIEAECKYDKPIKSDSIRAVAQYLYDVIQEGIKKGGFSYVDITDPIQLYNPANITKYLNLGVEKCPAENYVLAVYGHGGGWNIDQEYFKEYSKAVAWDQNFKEAKYQKTSNPITARELAEGIRASRLNGNVSVYMDACDMNAIENVSELANGALYYIASFYDTYFNDNYAIMRNVMERVSNPYAAYKAFRDSLVLQRDVVYESSIWDLSEVSELNKAIKMLVDSLKTDYTGNGVEKYNKLIENLAHPNGGDRDFSEFVDSLQFSDWCGHHVDEIAEVVMDKLGDAVNTKYREDKGVKIDKKSPAKASVYFVNNTKYQTDITTYGENVITESAFSKQTGWNEFLKLLTFQMK